jgi:ATP-dependent exoDNAse (exonuclease V) alpha subunit
VRRRTDRDPATGARGWSEGVFEFRDLANSELGYATTAHSAQGLTVSAGLAVVTGQESRQWLYSAMTRGAKSNEAIAFTTPRLASARVVENDAVRYKAGAMVEDWIPDSSSQARLI